MNFPWLTVLTLVPVVGGMIVVGLSGEQKKLSRRLAFLFSLISLAVTALIWANFDGTATELQLVERHDWIPTLGIQYFVGIDGLGLVMILLTAGVGPMALLASRNGEEEAAIYFALFLFLQAGLVRALHGLTVFHC